MEPNEVEELKEHAEHAEHEKVLRPVAFTMSLLAVLVAVCTVLGHRTHTEAVLNQDRATDQWNEYQAHKIRAHNDDLTAQLLSVVTIADENAARKFEKTIAEQKEKKAKELEEDKAHAEALETKVEQAEAHAVRFDFAEAMLEIGLVITSVTLLTRNRLYWYLGLVFSALGIASALSVLLLH
ncbi:MAG: DUF4337 domain-containing protein [Terracidiphilus sp.]